MKKRVFIGVLAALMLFAFVACDSNSGATSALEENIITGLTITSEVPTYFKGETADESSITVIATTLAGTEKALSENEVDFTLDTDVTTTSDSTGEPVSIGTVKYIGYNYSGNAVSTEVYAYIYTMDKVAVEGPDTLEMYYYSGNAVTSPAVNTSSYTVTGYAVDDDNKTLYERELVYRAKADGTVADDSEYTVAFPTEITAAGIGQLTFTAAEDFGTIAPVTCNATFMLDTVKSISLAVKDGVKIIDGMTWVPTDTTADDNNIGVNELFEAKEVYVSGATKPHTLTGTEVNLSGIGSPATFSTSGIYSATATIKSGEKTFTSNSVSVTVSPKTITSFTVSYEAGKKVASGESIVADYLTISPVWEKDLAVEGWKKDGNYTISNGGVVPAGLAENTVYPFVVTVNGCDKQVSFNVTVGKTTDRPEA